VVYGGAIKWVQLLAIPVFMASLSAGWLVAKASSRRDAALPRLLLLIQFALLTATFVFSGLTKPSPAPPRTSPGVAALLAVAAMACQYALLRLSVPGAVSTAVMTGNLTNFVLLSMLAVFSRPLATEERTRLRRSAVLLIGFLCGCFIAAGAVVLLADWAWIDAVSLGAAPPVLVPLPPNR